MKYSVTERVIVVPSQLIGTVRELTTVEGEQAYILELEHPSATEDGTYCARESELRKPRS